MRLLLFMLLILGLGFNSCSSKHEARTPKEIGPQSMELLNKMGEITKPEFSEFFISYQEMRDIADNESLNVDEKQKTIIKMTKKESLKVHYDIMFRRLKRTGGRIGVNWQKAKFVSFDFDIKDQGGLKFCHGHLEFKCMSRNYSVETTSVYDGDNYLLTSLDRLRDVNE